MLPFEQASIPPSEQRKNVKSLFQYALKLSPEERKHHELEAPNHKELYKICEKFVATSADTSIFINDMYQVAIYHEKPTSMGWPDMWHLSIRRLDRDCIHDWRELQAIKNDLLGPEAEAVELYPAESRCVDSANQYHLWAPITGQPWPFGFRKRLVTDLPLGKSVNRPLDTDKCT